MARIRLVSKMIKETRKMNRKLRRSKSNMRVDLTEAMYLDIKNTLNKMGAQAVKSQKHDMKNGYAAGGGRYPKRGDYYLRKLKERGRSTDKYMNNSGRFLKSIRKRKPRIDSYKPDRSFVTIATPKSQRAKGRGLIGNGFFWHKLTTRARNLILRTLRNSKVVKTKKITNGR